MDISSNTHPKPKPGWKAMPYILGNDSLERLASVGLLSNFLVYLRRVFQMSQVSAANVVNIWSAISNFSPLIGAFISDAYLGRFLTIAFASLAALMGMVTLTLTSWMPQLHPSPCDQQQQHCKGPTTMQMGILVLGLGFLSIGSGGIRPCSIPFGVDQFDQTTDKGRAGINSFFNWYYTTFTWVLLISVTLLVYIQDSVSWVLGFSIPTVFMLCSIIVFFFGKRMYAHVNPEGSILSSIAQVVCAAYKKRHLHLLPIDQSEIGRRRFYDPDMEEVSYVNSKLPLSNQLSFLNKAALILEDELTSDGIRVNKWSLCSIQQVEELKSLIKIIPIWASGALSFTSLAQQVTFTISQAMQMDRHLGPKFQIPPGSISVIGLTTVGLWVPFYDRFVVPALRKITKHENGITLLQRIGIGNTISVFSMVAAGLTERERRASAVADNVSQQPPRPFAVAPMSVMWLSPQLILLGFCEAFTAIGLIELFNKQFPDNMRSIGNSLFFCSFAAANYMSSLIVTIVHNVTGRDGRADWLTSDLNEGQLDYFYFLIAGVASLNLVCFLYCAKQYRYNDKGGL